MSLPARRGVCLCTHPACRRLTLHPSPHATPPPQECLTKDTIVEVLESCRAGKPIPMTKWGSRPMNGQLSCEGPLGKTSLFTPRVEPVPTRELKAKVDPASVKKHMMY